MIIFGRVFFMMRFKSKIFRIFNPVTQIFSFEKLSGLLPFDDLILVYHLVSDEDVKHVKHLFPYRSVKQFEKDLDFLSNHFEFVNWEDYLSQKKTSKPSILLTFDDGYSEFYDVISPILLRKGIFAINYINPKFIDNKEMMWRNKASLLVSKINENDKLKEKMFRWTKGELKHNFSSILNISFDNRNQLDDIADYLDIDYDQYLKTNPVYMTLEQLKKLKNDGFGIASHGWDHPFYNQLSVENQLENTQKALDYMAENQFYNDSFAFPFTDHLVTNHFFDSIFLRNPALKFTFGAAGIKKDSYSRNIQRVPMEIGNYPAQKLLKNEIIYYQFLKLLHKNIINRS